jgi:mRNA interferase HicA
VARRGDRGGGGDVACEFGARRPCNSHKYVRYVAMTGNEFEKRIRHLGRRRGVLVAFDRGHGKGSHGRLYYGARFTTLKDRKKEIGPGLLSAMLHQLGLTKADLED